MPQRLDVPSYAQLLERTDGPPGSSWGIFGAGDQLGMLNFLTPECAVEAAKLVKTGKTINLDYPLNAFVPSFANTRPATAHHMFANNPNHRDDWVDSFYLQSTSQVDGLRHIRAPRFGFYGGVTDDKISLAWPDQPELGVQLLAEKGIAGRGILLDAERYFQSIGDPLPMDRTRRINAAELDAIAAFCNVEVKTGDLVMLHLGWAKWWLTHTQQERDARQGGPGIEQSYEMLAWIWDHQISMFAADNAGLESGPPVPDSGLHEIDEPMPERGPSHNGTLHRQLIPMLGLIMGEIFLLEDLAADCAADGVYEFMLTCSPLNVIGGVGSPPNAIAIK
jgi:kynurenine formamidase